MYFEIQVIVKPNIFLQTGTWSKLGMLFFRISVWFGLQQLINEPTHLTANSSSCIDLIFISHPNLVMESGVNSSLHPNCHHQIVFAKLNLKICYPSPYEHEIWHYEKGNADLICRSIDQFPWDNRFFGIDLNQKVNLFNQTIKNILCNFIPQEIVTCDDCDPPWINSKRKGLIETKNFAKKIFSFFEDFKTYRISYLPQLKNQKKSFILESWLS